MCTTVDGTGSLLSNLLPRAILCRPPFRLQHASLRFRKGEKGRPSLEPPAGFASVFDFNCTHDHDYVCCGYVHGANGSHTSTARIGVDVMKLVNPFPECDAAEMLETLDDQLDAREKADIQRLGAADQQVKLMLRYWAHKEALVKATGEGVAAGLQTYRFEFEPETRVYERDDVQRDWQFSERMLDDDHLLVTAFHLPGYTADDMPRFTPRIDEWSVEDVISFLT